MSSTLKTIYDPDRLFRVWAIDEIYDGSDCGVYIPNVNDGVWCWNTGLYRVVAIDIETGLSTLKRHVPVTENPIITDEDILIGAVPGRVSESHRLYINSKTDPVTAVVDSRLHVYGSDNKYIRLFKGFDLSDEGNVISLYYDINNNLNDDKIPLELVATIEDTNRAVKTPLPGYATKGLDDGEVVTCVVYSPTGIVTSVNPLLVKNTSFIRNISSDNKYITHISLNSPFLLEDLPQQLEVPLNTTLMDLDLLINVHYSNGDSNKYLIEENDKISVEGLEAFIVSQEGQSIPLIVTYKLDENEANYCATSDDGRSISEIYQITTLPPSAMGVVKLFIIPVWSAPLNRWDLKYYLYNLDRTISKEVTEFVEVTSPIDKGFDPIDYGVLQTLTLTVDLANIDGLEVVYRHIQNFEITIYSAMAESVPSWTLGYVDGGSLLYGDNHIAKINSLTDTITINISQQITSLSGWLDRMFTPLYPLYSDVETKPMLPNYVILVYKDIGLEVPLTCYSEDIAFPIAPLLGDTIICKWLNRTEAKDYLLAISPLVSVY